MKTWEKLGPRKSEIALHYRFDGKSVTTTSQPFEIDSDRGPLKLSEFLLRGYGSKLMQGEAEESRVVLLLLRTNRMLLQRCALRK